MPLILDKNCPNLDHHNPLLNGEGWHQCNLVDSPEKTIKGLESQIEGLEKKNNKLKSELIQEKEEIVNKNQQIFQLNKTIEISKVLFRHQIDYLKYLASRLEDEQEKNKDNKDYQSHLRDDVKRLAEERKKIDSALKNLEEEEKKNKQLRDKEVADLRKEIKKRDDEISSIELILLDKLKPPTWRGKVPEYNLKSLTEKLLKEFDKIEKKAESLGKKLSRLEEKEQELEDLKVRIDNPTWNKFRSWYETNILRGSTGYEVSDDKKSLYPDLVIANFQTFSISVEYDELPILNVRNTWSQLIPANFVFGNVFKRAFKPKEFEQFGKIFDEWRKTLLIPACE